MDKNLLYLGGFGVLAALYISKQNNTGGSGLFANQIHPVTPVLQGAPPTPTSWDQNYYLTYQYPAILQMYPNVGNPNYKMSDSEAAQYISNYLDLQQVWADQNNFKGGWDNAHTLPDFARSHFKKYGIPEKRTFTPLVPSRSIAYVAPPKTENGGFFTSIGNFISKGANVVTSVIPYVAAFAGTNDQITLSPTDKEILLNGGGIMINIFDLYGQVNQQASEIMINQLQESIKSIL